MTIPEKLQASKDGLDALLNYANGVTGQDDANIGDAVKTLCDGFGQGGTGDSFPWYVNEVFEPTEDVRKLSYSLPENAFHITAIILAERKAPLGKAGLLVLARRSGATPFSSIQRADGTIGTEGSGSITFANSNTRLDVNISYCSFLAGERYRVLIHAI